MDSTVIILVMMMCVCVGISMSLGIGGGFFFFTMEEGDTNPNAAARDAAAGNISETSSTKDSIALLTTLASTPSDVATVTFSKQSNKETPQSERQTINGKVNESGGVVYLDRHPLHCEDGAINGFKMNVLNYGSDWQYQYSCVTGGDLAPIDVSKTTNQKVTPYTTMGTNEGEVSNLEAHNIDCGKDAVLQKFHLHRNPQNFGEWQYKYWCAPSNARLICRQASSIAMTKNDDPAKLRLLQVGCLENEALGQVQLVTSTKEPTKRQYKYTCCRNAQ
jgi:hypothetical protein